MPLRDSQVAGMRFGFSSQRMHDGLWVNAPRQARPASGIGCRVARRSASRLTNKTAWQKPPSRASKDCRSGGSDHPDDQTVGGRARVSEQIGWGKSSTGLNTETRTGGSASDPRNECWRAHEYRDGRCQFPADGQREAMFSAMSTT